jgi:hypothetical protein
MNFLTNQMFTYIYKAIYQYFKHNYMGMHIK